ncbi:hypothetical protein XCM_5340 [Xanthomonas citri pv. mangiferaeindicae]|nr:hypothetical protein XCM_5340 [Xanthomonas citri pv. mangiferaeindicae]
MLASAANGDSGYGLVRVFFATYPGAGGGSVPDTAFLPRRSIATRAVCPLYCDAWVSRDGRIKTRQTHRHCISIINDLSDV